MSPIDGVTGEPLSHYQHDHPGSLIDVDVTKFVNIPDGGGWRCVGRGRTGTLRSANRAPRLGIAVCTPSSSGGTSRLPGDRSRVPHVSSDEKAVTAIGVPTCASHVVTMCWLRAFSPIPSTSALSRDFSAQVGSPNFVRASGGRPPHHALDIRSYG